MIRILLVDDHPVVRDGLVAVLEDETDFQIVGSVGTVDEALRLVPRLRPDVILLDLELPGTGGIEALPRLAETSPDSRVIIFTAYDSDERVMAAIKGGAKGYVLKGAAAGEITQAVRAVHAGGSHLTPRVAAKIMAQVAGPRPASLTGRERQVLRLVAEGLATKQIALRLGISERTVKFHVTSVLNKLGAENRAQAVAVASQRGLI
jgi:DNA-binding NarL/FixJ family response regulator